MNGARAVPRWLFPLGMLALAAVPAFVLSDFRLQLLGKFLTFTMVAVGLNILWGYTGILSLGQGVFFALGAYGMGMHLKLQAGNLPDFMVWSGLGSSMADLPWFWAPFRSLPLTMALTVLVPSLLAFLIGIPTFRSGIKGVYFTILSQALALSISILFIGQQPYTGGTNGVTNFRGLSGISIYRRDMVVGLYFASAIILAAFFWIQSRLVLSRTGRVLVGIRDAENRLRFLGYDTLWFKVGVLTVSAAMASVGGALFVQFSGIVSPSNMGIVPSVEMAIWVLIGGRGTLWGPLVGTLATSYAKTLLSESLPDLWLYFFGTLIAVVVLLFPRGIVGSLGPRVRARFHAATPVSPRSPPAPVASLASLQGPSPTEPADG